MLGIGLVAKTILWGSALVASGSFLQKQLLAPHGKCSRVLASLVDETFSDLRLDFTTFDSHTYTLKLKGLAKVVENLELPEHLGRRLSEWIEQDYKSLIESEAFLKSASKDLYEIQESLRRTSHESEILVFKANIEPLRTQIRDTHDLSESVFSASLERVETVLRNLKVLDVHQNLNMLLETEYQNLLAEERRQLTRQ